MLTDRDEFAKVAMGGVLANSECSFTRADLAVYAYDFADAMMAEKAKRDGCGAQIEKSAAEVEEWDRIVRTFGYKPKENDNDDLADAMMAEKAKRDGCEKPVWEQIVELGRSIPPEEWDKVPRDLAANLHHYLYGTPVVRSKRHEHQD